MSGDERPAAQDFTNVILVGKKPALVYAVATLSQLNQGSKEVRLRARGMAISHAVDVVEILRRRFLGDRLRIKEIRTDTETVQSAEGSGQRNISTMEIVLGNSDQ
jgi:DNA-binding protein